MSVEDLLRRLAERGETLAAAESCTGGGILETLTAVPGSSSVVWGGVVTYSNEAKIAVLDVSPVLLDSSGAVSSGVAKAMAWGVKILSGAGWSIGVTGIAGPDGGKPENPVGTVWMAWSDPENLTDVEVFHFQGNRGDVRRQAVREALEGLAYRLDR